MVLTIYPKNLNKPFLHIYNLPYLYYTLKTLPGTENKINLYSQRLCFKRLTIFINKLADNKRL